MKVSNIYVGSWFQRTTLHLSEIYDFLVAGESPLKFDQKVLDVNRIQLDLASVSKFIDDFEYLEVETNSGISFSIYEDGLIVLKKDPTDNIKNDIDDLTEYYEKKLSPAMGYIFSLGAPIPKELANIKTIYPYFIVTEKAAQKEIDDLIADFNQEKHFELKEKTFEIHRGDTLYIINSLKEPLENIERFISEQIFMREFKGQMHRYLNLHRIIWENIAEVKEKGEIQGDKIGDFKNKIESYQKSINLIGTRINQMGLYVGTRSDIVKNNPAMEKFVDVFQYKYDTLNSTLSYVKEIWSMTSKYVDSALGLFGDLQAQATDSSIKNLTVVTSMGVGASLIGLFTAKSVPEFTYFGFLYFLILAVVGWGANRIMQHISLKKKYGIKDVKADRDIK